MKRGKFLTWGLSVLCVGMLFFSSACNDSMSCNGFLGLGEKPDNGSTNLDDSSIIDNSSVGNEASESMSDEESSSADEGNDEVEDAWNKNASQGLEFSLESEKEDENDNPIICEGAYYKVQGIGTCTDKDLVIPMSYNGVPVKEIMRDAFKDCQQLTSVKVPDSIKEIW